MDRSQPTTIKMMPRTWQTVLPDYYHALVYPYLLTDRVYHCDDRRYVGAKFLSRNEWLFRDNGQSAYGLPATFLLEIMAQMTGALDEHRQHQFPPRQIMLTRINQAEYFETAMPGDCLVVTVDFVKSFGDNQLYAVQTRVEDTLIAKCDMYFYRLTETAF